MKNIIQILSDAGLEITDEQKKTIETSVNENYKTLAEFEKQGRKLDTVTQERDTYKSQYDTAKSTLEGFEGKDFDAITKERDEWKVKAESAENEWKTKLAESEKNYAAKIEERDFNDALVKALAGEKFTSEFAKTGIISMIKEKGLKREGEKILGLDDYMTELRESQKDAFAQTDAPAAPTFTVPTTKGGESSKTPVYTPPTVW
nr:MAG TPA: minor structural protein [Caudoviricetes sp.]